MATQLKAEHVRGFQHSHSKPRCRLARARLVGEARDRVVVLADRLRTEARERVRRNGHLLARAIVSVAAKCLVDRPAEWPQSLGDARVVPDGDARRQHLQHLVGSDTNGLPAVAVEHRGRCGSSHTLLPTAERAYVLVLGNC
eukprot:scaffold9563_cov62-Phaeocystis_antarctica.AAC.3